MAWICQASGLCKPSGFCPTLYPGPSSLRGSRATSYGPRSKRMVPCAWLPLPCSGLNTTPWGGNRQTATHLGGAKVSVGARRAGLGCWVSRA